MIQCLSLDCYRKCYLLSEEMNTSIWSFKGYERFSLRKSFITLLLNFPCLNKSVVILKVSWNSLAVDFA